MIGAVLGAWTLGPPVYFWDEWLRCPFPAGSPQWKQMAHSPELSRNLWVAFVVVLAALFGFRWPGS